MRSFAIEEPGSTVPALYATLVSVSLYLCLSFGFLWLLILILSGRLWPAERQTENFIETISRGTWRSLLTEAPVNEAKLQVLRYLKVLYKD